MDFALSLGWFCIIYILTAKEALLQKFPAIRKSKYFARNPFFGKARSSSQSCRTANLRLFTHKLLSLLRRKSSNLHIDQKPESWKSKAHLQRKRNFPWVYYLEAELLQPKKYHIFRLFWLFIIFSWLILMLFSTKWSAIKDPLLSHF